MKDHNLDDLIIGDPKSQSSNSKSLLSIIALIIIILLVGVFLVQLIMSSPKDDISLNHDSNAEIISPELIPFDTKVNRKRTTENGSVTPLKRAQPPRNTDRVVAIEKPAMKQTIPKKPTVKKPTVKKSHRKKPVTKPSALFKKGREGYYVQIAALKNRPNKKYLTKLKKAGFRVVVHKVDQFNKVRVGPYTTRDKAKRALPRINSSLSVDGRIVKAKQ